MPDLAFVVTEATKGRPSLAQALIVEKAETASTNDDARALALEGAPHGSAVLAARQLAGRGRDGRSFASPEGGMYLSVVLRVGAPTASWGLIPLAAGVAVVDALADAGFTARLKWPNDVLIGERKCGGILVESNLGARPFAIVGIGVNLARAPEGVPNATALAEHGAAPAPRALAERVHARLIAEAARVERAPGEAVERARARCSTLGREVAWDGGRGKAIAIDADGALVVETATGRARIVAGDVRVRGA